MEATPLRLVVAATSSSLAFPVANETGDLAKRDGGVAFTLRRRGVAATALAVTAWLPLRSPLQHHSHKAPFPLELFVRELA